MTNLNKTQREVLAQAQRRGSLTLSTSIRRRGRFDHCVEGGREWRAAEKLADLGLLVRGPVRAEKTYVRGSMGYREERWTVHCYELSSDPSVLLKQFVNCT